MNLIFGIPPLRFGAAILIGIIGIALIGCGVNVCWTRFGRGKSRDDERPRFP